MSSRTPIILAIFFVFGLFSVGAILTLTILYHRCQTADPVESTKIPYHVISSGRQSAAEYLKEGLNPHANPCEDFYKFSCGNWSFNHPLPPDRRRFNTLIELQKHVMEKQYMALKDVDTNRNSTLEAIRKAKMVFDSCNRLGQLGRKHRKPKNVNPLVHLLQKSQIGMWPLMSYWSKTQKQKLSPAGLAGLLAGQFGVKSFLSPRVTIDSKDPSHNALYLLSADLTLDNLELYLNDTIARVALKHYRNTITEAARAMANDMDGMLSVTASSDVLDIINFEVNLARMVQKEHQRDLLAQYNAYTVTELKGHYPNITWEDYFTYLFPSDFETYRHRGSTLRVIVTHPEYLKELNEFLGKVKERTVYNYLIWRLIYSRLWILSPHYQDIHRTLREALDVTKSLPSHRIQCLEFMNEIMPFAMGRLFVENYFDSWTKSAVDEMIQQSKTAFKEVIGELTWMDMETKLKAKAKTDAVVANSAYPDWLYNDSFVNKLYQNLSIKPQESFFDMYNSIAEWESREQAYKLLNSVDRSSYFGASPALSNAWYDPSYNEITLPAGLLQPPAFQASYPAVVRFAGLGFIIGHELNHQMDIQGIQFGPNGTLNLWVDSYSQRGLLSLGNCLVNEYNNFCYPELDLCVNGKKTLEENLADNGGIQVAYKAYKNNVGEESFPGLQDYTLDQIFFISFARLWCGEAEDEAVRQMLYLNHHAPNKVRVMGTLRNFKPFADAFKCDKGSAMVSDKPCQF